MCDHKTSTQRDQRYIKVIRINYQLFSQPVVKPRQAPQEWEGGGGYFPNLHTYISPAYMLLDVAKMWAANKHQYFWNKINLNVFSSKILALVPTAFDSAKRNLSKFLRSS